MTPSQPPPPLDIVTVLIFVAGLVFRPDLAAYIGPYVVIALATVLASFWSASTQADTSRARVLSVMLGTLMLSLLITVPIAEWASQRWGAHVHGWLVPVALLIGGIGANWPRVFRWLIGLGRRLVEGLLDAYLRGKGAKPEQGDSP